MFNPLHDEFVKNITNEDKETRIAKHWFVKNLFPICYCILLLIICVTMRNGDLSLSLQYLHEARCAENKGREKK